MQIINIYKYDYIFEKPSCVNEIFLSFKSCLCNDGSPYKHATWRELFDKNK